MSSSATSLSAEQTTRWRSRVESLGLDPDLDARNYRVLRTTHSLEELKKMYNAPAFPFARKCDLTAAKVSKLPDALMRRHVERHISGECVVSDPEVIKAIEQRVR